MKKIFLIFCFMIAHSVNAGQLPPIIYEHRPLVEYINSEYSPEFVLNEYIAFPKRKHGNSVYPYIISEREKSFKGESGKTSLGMGIFGLLLLVYVLL